MVESQTRSITMLTNSVNKLLAQQIQTPSPMEQNKGNVPHAACPLGDNSKDSVYERLQHELANQRTQMMNIFTEALKQSDLFSPPT
eukprot:CAMPEP_0196823364 /NCGR_PEP_ID=MMETSP1362-20130617/87155_1 /TAXON_ID=163516 /ORGANISM="Leptocylindrus danicus, Strain CCMP1856" /LENGTH=85 /DNA_ID=CAMNT_0042203203 /DNA_START=50 /DNA_END=304 /DNA_ORIENTATION=-